MRFQGLATVIAAASVIAVGFACQQAALPAAVAPDDPVITLEGFCSDSPQQGRDCRTVITREQFDRLAEALQPGMPPPLRLKVANAYARNLKMTAAAEKRGLDKAPEFAEEMRYARMQLLSQDLVHALERDANLIADADIANYYRKNQASYEEATVARIFVPHSPQGAALAAALRARAAGGEDPDKLQIEAYAQAGIVRDTLRTRIEKIRRSALPPTHEAVMDLQAGEVSAVFSDPDGAYFIYKMLNKETLPLEDAKPQIRAAIASQRYRDATDSFREDIVFNDAYFNPPGNSATASSPHRHITHVH